MPDPDPEAAPDVVHDGILWKKKGYAFGRYKMRRFTLCSDGHLNWYNLAYQYRGTLQVFGATVPDRPDAGGKFTIQTREKTLRLKSETEAAAELWLQTLRVAASGLGPQWRPGDAAVAVVDVVSDDDDDDDDVAGPDVVDDGGAEAARQWSDWGIANGGPLEWRLAVERVFSDDNGVSGVFTADAETLVPRCPLCRGDYRQDTVKPRVLGCYHTFCADCLAALVRPRDAPAPASDLAAAAPNERPSHEDPRAAGAAEGAPSATIECPRCRAVTPLGPSGVRGLTRNFALDVLQAPPAEAEPVGQALDSLAEAVGVTCPICLDVFAYKTSKTPRLLPCGHSACTKCLWRAFRAARAAACAVCKAAVPLGPEGPDALPVNFALQRYSWALLGYRGPSALDAPPSHSGSELGSDDGSHRGSRAPSVEPGPRDVGDLGPRTPSPPARRRSRCGSISPDPSERARRSLIPTSPPRERVSLSHERPAPSPEALLLPLTPSALLLSGEYAAGAVGESAQSDQSRWQQCAQVPGACE